MYVYIQSERQLWTVGFYRPDGQWQPESDHETTGSAAQRAAYLNGGSKQEQEWAAAGLGNVAVEGDW